MSLRFSFAFVLLSAIAVTPALADPKTDAMIQQQAYQGMNAGQNDYVQRGIIDVNPVIDSPSGSLIQRPVVVQKRPVVSVVEFPPKPPEPTDNTAPNEPDDSPAPQ